LSLRLQINLIIVVMMTLFIGTLVYQQVQDTRSSVREEIEGSNRVAIQLLTAVSGAYEQAGVRGMLSFLDQLGRVRANDVSLYNPAGQLVYSSPASVYKVGREAPPWYATIVAPIEAPSEIGIGGGRLVIRANSTRAVLDGWDSLVQLLGSARSHSRSSISRCSGSPDGSCGHCRSSSRACGVWRRGTMPPGCRPCVGARVA
jgi:two-component system sensor histidine kinase UhpB